MQVEVTLKTIYHALYDVHGFFQIKRRCNYIQFCGGVLFRSVYTACEWEFFQSAVV